MANQIGTRLDKNNTSLGHWPHFSPDRIRLRNWQFHACLSDLDPFVKKSLDGPSITQHAGANQKGKEKEKERNSWRSIHIIVC